MSGDPGHSKFLINLQQLGTLCKEHGKDALFTDYLLSIPTGNTVEQIKKDQNPSCQHPRTFGREFSQKKHEIPRKDNRNNNETVSGDAKKGRINARDEVCKKGKVEENQLCMFCKKNRVLINHHYLKVHKLDINVWVKNLKERNRRNAFICPQCNKDYRNSTAFRQHLSNFHNIHLDKNRRRLKKKDAQELEDMPAKGNNGDRGRVGAGWSVKKITPVQEEGNESNDEERELQRGVSRGGKVDNTNARKINHVEVKERCKQCGEFVEVASFDRHAASHAKERETFPFKPNRAKILSYFLKDTLKKTGQRKEDGNLVSHSRFVSDNERINVNQDNLIRNKTNLAGNLVENGVANEHEEHTKLDHESSDETILMDTPHDVILEKLQAEAVSIDKKVKQHRKLLWREFFKRMRNEDTVFQAELFKQYVLLYRDM